jgi:factor associated with neutral sphingomyelinase activation
VADRILPLTRNSGRVVLTSARIYFQPFNNVDPEPVFKFK